MENSDINVLHVVDIFLEENISIRTKYGMNILQENKPMNSFQKSINAVQELSEER